MLYGLQLFAKVESLDLALLVYKYMHPHLVHDYKQQQSVED